MHGYLERYESTSNGTFGMLILGDLALATVERPWLNNKPFESCVPDGTYDLVPFKRKNGDNVYAFVSEELRVTKYEEPGCFRYSCLIHVGNTVDDVVGCIAPGMNRHDNMVSTSRTAVGLIMQELGGAQDHKLTIKWGQV